MKKAFTLVELIVVITILAILWTIAFISLSWYSRDVRDSKRTTDTSALLSKINLEEIKWTDISELITNTKTGFLHILWTPNREVQTFWEANFKNLKEDWNSFKDPKNKSQNYPMAYAIWGTWKNAYKFYQIASVSEKENKNIIKWDYYRLDDENDDESLFLSGSIKYTEKADSDLVYELEWVTPKEDSEEEVVIKDCEWTTKDWYTLDDTKNWETTESTKTDSDIELSATKTFLCKNWEFIQEWETEVINITCNKLHYPEKDKCKKANVNPMNDPNNIWKLNLIDWKLWTQDSYYLDSVTWLAWQTEIKEWLAWAKSNDHRQPVWDWTEYSYPAWDKSEYPAFEYCRSLGSKWRVPTIKELVTLVNFEGFNDNWWQSFHPGISYIAEKQENSWINSLEEYYYKDKPNQSSYVNFMIWDINAREKNIPRNILCVHDFWEIWNWIKWIQNNSKADRYSEYSLNWTWAVLDSYTGKYWTKWSIWLFQYSIDKTNPEPKWNNTTKSYDYNWLTADKYPAFEACTAIWAWWRMPSFYELLSLVDYKNKNLSNFTTSLEYIKQNQHWSSTKLIQTNHEHQAFYITFYGWATAHYLTEWIEKKWSVICIHD